MNTTVNVKTWICNTCPFRWQFSGDALGSSPYDLSLSQLHQQFPEPQFVGLAPGNCPNCHAQGRSCPLGLAIDPAQMSMISVSSDEALASTLVPEVDVNGQTVMVKTGTRFQLNQNTGQIEEVDVFEPKQRELTPKEFTALQQERDSNLDSLEAVAVKEVTQTKEELK